MYRLSGWLFWGLSMLSGISYAQVITPQPPATNKEPSSITHTQDSLTYSDSLSIFNLIDSLLLLEESSQLGVRLNYNSNVLSAGRTLGIQQFGISPGVSYYHKSGAFVDISGFWTNDYIPKYYLTTISAGYSYLFTKKFSAIFSYDRFLYRSVYSDSYIPYSNALTVSPFFDFHSLTFRSDYSFYFGEAAVHRFMPGVTLTLEKKHYKKIKRIAFTPSFYLLIGNEKITELTYPYTNREMSRRQRLGLPWYETKEKNIWGTMNYAINLPFYISFGHWSTSLGYTYSIPKPLIDEPFTLTNTGFLTASCIYYVSLKSRKAL